jgi:hypothetical protein
LNLTVFDPRQCEQSRVNITANSWTCRSDKLPYNVNLLAPPIGGGGRRSPTVFLKGLDNPELGLLNIKFPFEVPGRKFLDVVSAVNNSCLGNLTELAPAGGGWFPHCRECGHRPRPQIRLADLTGLNMLLPLPQLKILRLSVAPNFLDILNLKLYRSITAGHPAPEKLSLGHAEFCANYIGYGQEILYERVSLHHLAAFCSMLPNIKEVSIGTIDGLTLEEPPRTEWACLGVESPRISHHADIYRGVILGLLRLGLEIYFPNSGLAKHPLYRREDMFNRAN